jgi:hypothetical protein
MYTIDVVSVRTSSGQENGCLDAAVIKSLAMIALSRAQSYSGLSRVAQSVIGLFNAEEIKKMFQDDQGHQT